MACFHVWCGFEGRHCDKCAPKAAGRAGGDVRYTLIQTLKAVGGIHNPEANASIIADAVIDALALPAPVVEGDVEAACGRIQKWMDDEHRILAPGEAGVGLAYDDVTTVLRAARATLSEGRSHG